MDLNSVSAVESQVKNKLHRDRDKIWCLPAVVDEQQKQKIKEIAEDGISVHYFEWPDDDGKVAKERVLVMNDKNKAIFEEQDQIRKELEKEEEEEEAGEDEKKDDDGDDYKEQPEE